MAELLIGDDMTMFLLIPQVLILLALIAAIFGITAAVNAFGAFCSTWNIRA